MLIERLVFECRARRLGLTVLMLLFSWLPLALRAQTRPPVYTPLNMTAPPTAVLHPPLAPTVLPGAGLAGHDFFYAGEARQEKMLIVRNGEIVWSYAHPAQGEISDATLYAGGNILFAHQHGITEINTSRQVVWNYDAPTNTEIHTAIHAGPREILFIQNGNPAGVKVINMDTGVIEKQFSLPVGKPKSTHGQFRHARLTETGNLLVAHMDLNRVCEYDDTGKAVWTVEVPGPWSATPLKNGHILVCTSKKSVLEINRAGKTVWQFNASDAPNYVLSSIQLATRLTNGHAILNNWFNEWSGQVDPANAPVQALEVTADKQIVWALRSWRPPADLGPATTIQLLDEPVTPMDYHFGVTH